MAIISVAFACPQQVIETKHHQQVATGKRFAFVANWQQFLSAIDDRRITLAERSLQQILG